MHHWLMVSSMLCHRWMFVVAMWVSSFCADTTCVECPFGDDAHDTCVANWTIPLVYRPMPDILVERQTFHSLWPIWPTHIFPTNFVCPAKNQNKNNPKFYFRWVRANWLHNVHRNQIASGQVNSIVFKNCSHSVSDSRLDFVYLDCSKLFFSLCFSCDRRRSYHFSKHSRLRGYIRIKTCTKNGKQKTSMSTEFINYNLIPQQRQRTAHGLQV